MQYEKLGLIFEPSKKDWQYSHAQNPLPVSLGDGLYRIYISTRDEKNRAQGAFFDFDLNTLSKVGSGCEEPILCLGSLGAFDDSGVMPSSIIRSEQGKIFMYYTGWSKCVDVPFSFHIGLAVSDSYDGPFERYSRAPILGRNLHDPYIVGAPFVLYDHSLFKMWYVSCVKWERKPDGEVKHYYTIKYAQSSDGLIWQTSANLCIPFSENEYAIARPVVYKKNDQYKMLFSYRGGPNTYRIGEAFSDDGIHWNRVNKEFDLNVSSDGWDSEMICYPYPVDYKGNTFIFYNGNSYGKEGVGLAVLT